MSINKEVLEFFVLVLQATFLCLPLTIYDILQNGSMSKAVTEPFISRQGLVASAEGFIFAIVFAIGNYSTLSLILFVFSLIVLVISSYTFNRYYKQKKS